MTDNLITIQGTVPRETSTGIVDEGAIFADVGLDEAVWLPKSQLEDWPDEGEFGDIMLPQWLLEEKGIV
jgi:hypothetical protein